MISNLPVIRAGLIVCVAFALNAQAARRLVDIKIDGVTREQRQNIERFLGAASLEVDGGVELSEFNAFIVRAPENVAKALQPYGYFSSNTKLDTTRDGNNRLVRLTIVRGVRTRVKSVTIDVSGPAASDEQIKKAIARFPLEIEDSLIQSRYESGKRAIQNALSAQGYFDAKALETRLIIDRENASAEIRLKFLSGERYAFGEISISGAQFEDAFVREYLAMKSGELYADRAILETQQRLNDSEYFSAVTVAKSLPKRASGRVPITITLVPAPRTRYSGGLSLGTNSGIGVQASIDRRYVNRLGHKARADALVSQRRNALGLSYLWPREDLAFDSVSLNYRDERFEVFTANATELTFSRNDRRGLVERSYGLTALNEDFEIGATFGSAQLLYPFARLVRIKRDDLLNTRRGYSATAVLRAGGGSKSRFVEASFATKWIFPAGDKGRWLLRGEVAALKTNDFDNLPPSLRLFAGGDVSVRGYTFQALSPTDSSGEPIGGSSLLVLSGEYERSINERFGVAGFVDAGNAFRDQFGSLGVGVGIGLRVATPVGPVKLDFAVPLNGDSGFKIHLVIGPDL